MGEAARQAVVSRVVALEQELQTPACRRDRDRLAVLLAEDFVEIGASGTEWTRATVIEHLLSEHFPTDGATAGVIEIVDLTADVLHESMVRTRWTSLRDGRTVRRSSLWRREPTGWRLVHHQGTPLPLLRSENTPQLLR